MVLCRPHAGGTEIEIDDTEMLVITPESPLGSQIMGLEAGAKVSLELGGRKQRPWSERPVSALLFAAFLGQLLGRRGLDSLSIDLPRHDLTGGEGASSSLPALLNNVFCAYPSPAADCSDRFAVPRQNPPSAPRPVHWFY